MVSVSTKYSKDENCCKNDLNVILLLFGFCWAFGFYKYSLNFYEFSGRNLEKFLRRNSYSSDERDTSTPITTKCKNKTKSLESLTDVKDRTGKVSAPLKEKEKKTSEETEEKVEEKLKSMETKVVVKQSGEKLDKKKSHFNYESIIEITLPSSQANLIPPASHIPLCDRIVAGEDKEEPIKPIICTSTKPKIPSQNMNKSNLSPISTHESFVSNKQNPMEWDTFIPVSC